MGLPALIAAMLIAIVAPPSGAQDIGGAIEGHVLDAAGAPLAAAHVSITGAALLGRRDAVSDARGRFHLPALPVGRYDVRVGRMDHRGVLLRDVSVELGRVSDVGEIRLEVAAIEVTEVSVAAETSRVVTRATTVGGSLSARAMRDLPSDRDYQSIVTLLPHATLSYSGDRANLAGTSGPESNYYVDGANVVEPPGNAVSTSLPYNFVEEIEVRAGGYQAEYGGAGGGVVNAVTASGGNDFRGQVFGFYADRLLMSAGGNSGASSRTTDYASWDAGASLGGPIVKDRLWFFAAYDPAREREDIRLPGDVVRGDARRSHRFAGKLTARLDDRTQAVLAALGDPGSRDQIGGIAPTGTQALGNLDPMLGVQRLGGASVSLRLTRVLGPAAFAEVVGGLFGSRFSFAPATARGAAEPLYVDARTGYVEGGFGSATDRRTGRSTLRAAVAAQVPRHRLKAGLAYEDEHFTERLDFDQVWRVADDAYQTVTLDGRRSASHVRAPSAFVQDAWDASEHLCLEVGLRWSRESWVASGGEVGQRLTGQWQPRAGVICTPGGASDGSLFASWGRFYQRTRLTVPGFFLQDEPSTYFVRVYDHDPRLDPTGGTTRFAQTLGHQPEVEGLRGASFDESQVGAEWALGRGWSATLRAVHRAQRDGIVGAFSASSGQAVYGNPGRGELAPYPKVRRIYRALELTADHLGRGGLGARLSYVWSSLRGNYEGYWGQSAGTNDPIGGAAFIPELAAAAYSDGLLPNDRPHQLKAHASCPIGHGLSVGATLAWSSGAPISELGATRFGAPYYQFLQPRGSLGRTPSIYDLSLRVAYEPFHGPAHFGAPRLLADVYHVGNPRRVVVVDPVHYRAVDTGGQQIAPNPNYGKPLFFQPAIAFRAGFEVNF